MFQHYEHKHAPVFSDKLQGSIRLLIKRIYDLTGNLFG